MMDEKLKLVLVEDYLKYMEYAKLSKDNKMSYLKPKGIYLVNYIEQLFDKLFSMDIDEYINNEGIR